MRDRGAWQQLLLLPLCAHVQAQVLQLHELDSEHLFSYTLRDAVADFARVNFNIFSKETVLVGSVFMSLYALAVQIDEPLHAGLYDCGTHRNLFEIGCCSKPFVEDIGVALPLVFLATGCLCADDPNTKVTGSVLLSGAVAIGIVKDVIKDTLSHPIAYRPYSGLFCKNKVPGGFPSGHAAVLMYATMLFALRKGARWAIPIGMYSGLVVGLLACCSYHYVSQLVAGMGLGAIYAVAAHHVVRDRVQDWEFKINVGRRGALQLGVEYSF